MALNNLRGAEAANVFMGALETASVAFQVANVFTTSQTAVNFPRITTSDAADWVAEDAEIIATQTGGDTLTVTPAKLAKLEVISRELAEDSNPGALDILGQALGFKLADATDDAFFGSKGASTVRPAGLADLAGITAINASPTAGIDAYVDGIAALEAHGAKARAIVMHPDDAATLAKIKTATGSNQLAFGDVALGTAQTVLGVPLFRSKHVAKGSAYILPADRINLVVRQDHRIDVDASRYFEFDQVGVKATTRIGFAFLDAAAIVRIKTTP